MSNQKNSWEQRARRHYLLAMILSCAVLYALSVFALAPLYSSLSNNVIYMSSWVVYIPEFALEIVEIAVYTVSFSVFVYVLHTTRLKKAIPFFLSYALLLILRRVASLGMGILSYGSLDILELQSSLWYVILDVITAGIVILFAARKSAHHQKTCMEIKKLKEHLKEPVAMPTLYPFESAFSKTNSLQLCALFTSLFLTLEKIGSRVIFDLFYGAPADLSDALIMAIYYLTDILMGFLIYVGMLWLFGRMHRHAKHLEAKEKEADAAQATPAPQNTSSNLT